MNLPFHQFIFIQFLFSLFPPIITSFSSPPLCHENESSALLQFKQSFTINQYTCYDPFSYPKTSSWNPNGQTTDCCKWEGVHCDEKTGDVISLDLSSSCLYGSINSTTTLFNLVHLQSLNLAYNNFNFSKIPSGFSHLSELTYLNLSKSFFSGQIPLEISHLSHLSSLDLSSNIISYDESLLQLQKPSLDNFIQNLTKLEKLHLSWVNISSSVPEKLAHLSSLTSLLLDGCELYGEFPSGIFLLPNLKSLDLSYNQDLNGSLPEFNGSSSLTSLSIRGTNFFGEIPSSIGKLGFLNQLDLSHCHFSGIIPFSMANLTQLKLLDLSANFYLTPSSLSWVGSLTKLTVLGLFYTNLKGEIPSSFGNLTQLTYLDLASNQLTGEIHPSIFSLSKLTTLWLSYNQFTGQISPNVKNLTQLIALDLTANILEGPIPSSIQELKHLQELMVYLNNLSGKVELEMFLNLKELNLLHLSFNKLSLVTKTSTNVTPQKFRMLGLASCNLDEFPKFLFNQDKLLWLDLSSNNIRGQIHEWILNTSTNTLQFLNLSSNFLTGFERGPVVLPWTSLSVLDLRLNMLQGSLPVAPVSLAYYLLSNNNMTGEIMPWICNLNSLVALDLSFNNLSGMLPQCLGNFSDSLSILNLQSNKFHGSIPQTFTSGIKLNMIDLSHNQLEGQVPRSMVNCSVLEFIDFGHNQISDMFPYWLGRLPELRVLNLRSNQFHGAIGKPENSFVFPNLHIIDLSHNNFNGYLPSEYFMCWNGMKVGDEGATKYLQQTLNSSSSSVYMYYGSYDFSVTMSNKGIEIEYVKLLDIFTAIDLSSNNFYGEIPALIGNLKGLHMLKLSNNNLTGIIPISLEELKNLESLDLSQNKLSGAIPQQLVQLTFLEFFNVSHNHLKGPIPNGQQFNTFPISSFAENLGLCGSPLPKKCANNEPPTPFSSEQHDDSGFPFEFDWKIILMGFGSGLVVGAVIGDIMTSKRHGWFLKTFGSKQMRRNRRTRRRP